jgi:hypothetical protein
VAFDPAWGGPASLVMSNLVDWTTHPDPGVKYYSGRAVYRTTVQVPALPAGARAHLNLGAVRSVASVRVNGTPLGLVWCAPWRIDATRALRAGRNDLEIEVINGWHNRLVGDAALPESQRRTWVAVNPPKASAPLAPSGLTGPVTVETD